MNKEGRKRFGDVVSSLDEATNELQDIQNKEILPADIDALITDEEVQQKYAGTEFVTADFWQ